MSRKIVTPRVKTVLSLAALALLIAGGILYAGPLNPPAGPITPTYKTLTEVEPRIAINAINTPGDADSLFKISQPGSYYLTANLTAVANKHGIEITAPGVTVDLNGFDLVGIPAMGSFDAVATTVAGLANVTILNGSCRNWGGDGIDLGSDGVTNARIEGVHASGNTGIGIRSGSATTLVNCSARSNISGGFALGSSSSVSDCTSTVNGGPGFTGSISVTYSNCAAQQNTGVGFNLFSASIATNCSASFNNSHGFSIINGSHVTSCTSLGNSGDGIRATFGCTILNNNCDQNPTGIHIVNSDNRIDGNHVSNCTLGYDIDGISNLIVRNSSSDNTTHWNIVANNIYGPIINRTAPAYAAVNGVSAASTLGSTDANANFSY